MNLAARLRLTEPAYAPLWLLGIIALLFCAVSPQFRRPEVAVQILEHASSTAIVALGMTFVLLTAGIDLSVGAVMLLAGAVGGKLLLAGVSSAAVVLVMLVIGAAWGLVNGLLITRLRMTPFIVTLAMLFVGRGAGLWITQTRAMNLPDRFRVLSTGELLAIPVPIWLLAISALAACLILLRTPSGRHLYAIGYDADAARMAGLPVDRLQTLAYVASGLFAALAGAITLSQLSTISPTLGTGKELEAIAAAVLGGVSLFGGRGGPLGAVVGAMLIQTIYSGLNILDADPQVPFDIDEYYYPLITSGIVFLAVLVDCLRRTWIERSQRPLIRPMDFGRA